MQELNIFIKKCKERLFTATSNNIDNVHADEKTTKTRKQKREEKQLYEDFKRKTDEIAHEKIWLRKRNLMRKTESLRIAAQNNAIRTN